MSDILFDEWGNDKKMIDKSHRINFPHAREIRSVKLGKNIGYEEDGKSGFLRPVIVIKKLGNLYFVLPLTTKGKDKHPFYHSITSINFGKPSSIILSQGRVIDSKRFILKIAKLGGEEFQQIKNILKEMYL